MRELAVTMDAVRMALRRRYRTQVLAYVWRGYANLILVKVKYVCWDMTLGTQQSSDPRRNARHS